MNDDYQSQLLRLRQQAARLPDGSAKLAVLEEAVRLADTHGDRRLGNQLRYQIIRAGTFSGAPEKSLVAFSWCLAQCDKYPEENSERALLWEFKWIVNSLPSFPQISRAQINATIEDMARRYQRCGASLRAVHKLRSRIAMYGGDVEESKEQRGLWVDAPQGWPADCAACDRNDEVEYLVFSKEHEHAVQHAQPILAGRLRCAEIPHLTLGLVLLPLVRLGRVPDGMACHQKGYRLIRGNPEFLQEAAQHLTFLTLTENVAKAVQLLERHLPWALETMDLGRRFTFYLSALFLLDRLRESGKETIKLRLPQTFRIHQESGKYEATALSNWFSEEAHELAKCFDARNGNDYFRRRLAENEKLKELVQQCPLRQKEDENDV